MSMSWSRQSRPVVECGRPPWASPPTRLSRREAHDPVIRQDFADIAVVRVGSASALGPLRTA